MFRIFIYNNITSHIVDKNGVELNKSTIKQIILACNQILPRVAVAWNIICPEIVYYTEKLQPKSEDLIFYIVDDIKNIPEEDFIGYILAKTIVDNGGFILSDKSISDSIRNEVHIHGSQQSTVAAALFHELAETIIDNTINSWWKSDSIFCATEICDPVQQNFIVIKVGNVDIALSDFILPAWKDNKNTIGPYNYIKTIKSPFTVDIGGYMTILNSDGNTEYIFNKDTPEWDKTFTYRSSKRYIKNKIKRHKSSRPKKIINNEESIKQLSENCC
jgi:hypothetical protein